MVVPKQGVRAWLCEETERCWTTKRTSVHFPGHTHSRIFITQVTCKIIVLAMVFQGSIRGPASGTVTPVPSQYDRRYTHPLQENKQLFQPPQVLTQVFSSSCCSEVYRRGQEILNVLFLCVPCNCGGTWHSRCWWDVNRSLRRSSEYSALFSPPSSFPEPEMWRQEHLGAMRPHICRKMKLSQKWLLFLSLCK